MKKFLKFNATLLGVGIILVNIYQLKRRHDNQIENKIIKNIQSRYQGFQIKGTWLQKHEAHYLGGITVMKDGHLIKHRFIATRHGEVILKN